mmetsp:Transcript_372/g.1246  ORF Transcript_372/g.1246 Transcript_372/m.1246 type:complete len:81 (+) Transcript_372:1509-1751(+)
METTKIQWYYVAAFVALMICVSASVRVVHAAVNAIIPSNEVFFGFRLQVFKRGRKRWPLHFVRNYEWVRNDAFLDDKRYH